MKLDVVSVRVHEEDAFSPRGPEPGNNNSNKQYHSNQTCKQDPRWSYLRIRSLSTQVVFFVISNHFII